MSARRNNLTDHAREFAKQSQYHVDRNFDIRKVVGELLSAVHAVPETELIASFVSVAPVAGIASSRWRGCAKGLVRQMLRELERGDRAVCVRYTAAGVEREELAWAAPPFDAPRPKTAVRTRPSPAAQALKPVGEKGGALAMLQQEINDVREEFRARLNRMEAQLAAMEASAGGGT